MEISLLLMQQIAELFLMIFMGLCDRKSRAFEGGRQQGYIKDRFVSDYSPVLSSMRSRWIIPVRRYRGFCWPLQPLLCCRWYYLSLCGQQAV